MRKILEVFGLAALAGLIFLTVRAFYGPAHLPARIPTHFAADGRPDAWGPSAMLLIFPAIALALYLLMTVVARYPSAFNYPVRVTPANHAQLENLALRMIAWLKTELACLFAMLQWFALRAARQLGHGIPAVLMPCALVAILGTIAWHVAAMFRAIPGPTNR